MCSNGMCDLCGVWGQGLKGVAICRESILEPYASRQWMWVSEVRRDWVSALQLQLRMRRPSRVTL